MHHFLDDRGGHAHKDTDQVIVAISGSFELLISDGNEKQKIVLDNPIKGVFIPRLLFVDIYNCSNNSVCLVLANTHYDISKSFRSWDEYIQHIHG
jgi:dTDP-4-dehydrorhamnose 3,5-epimerase-like enzyme